MAHPTDAVVRQIQRLADELKGVGDASAVASLEKLLSSAQRRVEMAPSRVTQSRADTGGLDLAPQTAVPVDRETAVPLAEFLFDSRLPADEPVLDEQLRSAVAGLLDEWKQPEALERVGLVPQRTCLVYGAPGTGKTHLALWIARQLGLPVVVARLDGMISSFLGTTSRNIGTLFGFANRHRCLLLLDEFDAIAKLRDDPQEVGEIKRVVNTVLQNLDTRRGIGLTIAITNHERLLDPAIWRRFEVHLAMPRPALSAREEIARRYIAPVEISEPFLKLIAWLSDGCTGADIETIVLSLKRDFALGRDDDGGGVLASLRQFAVLNAERLRPDRRSAILNDQLELAKVLAGDDEARFEQKELAVLFERNKGTISRWLRPVEAKRAR